MKKHGMMLLKTNTTGFTAKATPSCSPVTHAAVGRYPASGHPQQGRSCICKTWMRRTARWYFNVALFFESQGCVGKGCNSCKRFNCRSRNIESFGVSKINFMRHPQRNEAQGGRIRTASARQIRSHPCLDGIMDHDSIQALLVTGSCFFQASLARSRAPPAPSFLVLDQCPVRFL